LVPRAGGLAKLRGTGHQENIMRHGPLFAIVWLLIGMALMGIITWVAMPSVMLVKRPSPHGYDETVAMLSQALAAKPDCRVLTVNDYQKSTEPFGAIEPTGSINICNPRYASRILANDVDRGVTAFMPLAIGVYQDRNGQVYVARLNVGLLGRMFGGTIAEVMGAAGGDLQDTIASVTSD